MADIIFTGNVGADAELRHTRDGKPVLNVRVCDSKSRKLQNGEWETLAEQWFNVSLFGPTGEALSGLRKGDRVKVAGEFYTREYEGRNGPGLTLDVRAVGIQMFPRRAGSGGGYSAGGQAPQQSWDSPQASDGDPWAGQAGGGWDTPATNEPPF